jgi:hypothetical protein
VRALIEKLKQAFQWNYDRELARSIQGLERKAEELREERDRRVVEGRP